MVEFTPKEIVNILDLYIVGQKKAKKTVAVALRNRYRRNLLPKYFKEEIKPKNILMIGPTGVGKTEIVKRLWKCAQIPFVKVEATKFTEVGYVGRDVESMVRDLVEVSIRMLKNKCINEKYEMAKKNINDKILELLIPMPKKEKAYKNPFELLFETSIYDDEDINMESLYLKKIELRNKLESGLLEDELIEITIEEESYSSIDFFSGMGNEEININMNDLFGGLLPPKTKKRKVSVKEARKILVDQEAKKLLDMDEIIQNAISIAEQSGLIFIDEIDKIATSQHKGGLDVSREGVQRDILPIVEGCVVNTKYGPVKTDHILFIGAGAFKISKVSDLIPELQGRFPVSVKLESLTRENFKAILVKPQNALIKQYKELFKTEGIEIDFTDDAISEIADIAYNVNEATEDIGARRLHTILENLLEDLSFNLSEMEDKSIVIDKVYVDEKMESQIAKKDINEYIL